MGSALADAPARVAGKYERLCWERHARDLALAALPGGHPKGLYFDPDAGERAVTFIETYCRHYEGEWAGELIVLEEWQRNIYRAVFGWMRADDTRRFRTAYIEIPRKNGKSVKGSATGIYLTVADDEGGAQVYSAATKKDQAKITHTGACRMIKASPDLKRFLRVMRNNISCARLGSKFEPLGADSGTLDGLNTHGLIEDETHAHKDRHVHDVIVTSMGARRQPLAWIITTAGVYDPESIGWELHDRAVKVLDQVFEDDSFFAFIAAADDGDDWREPETWARANPNLGVSVKLDYLAQECERAKTTPSYLNTFKRYHLNIWTQQREAWIPIEKWNGCTRVVDPEQLRRRRCYGGLDLSSKLDLSAFVLAFPDGDAIDLLYWYFCPEATIQRRSREDRVPYDAWVRDGWMIATPGDTIDYAFIHQTIEDAASRYEIAEIAFDEWNANETATKLGERGLTMVAHRQGFGSMSEPSKDYEAKVIAGRLGHLTPRGAHPVTRWMMSNVAIRHDPADNIKPDKSQAKGRIDGVVASIMAVGRANIAPAAQEWGVVGFDLPGA
jgi:phage terminase large subunit-like protein